MGFLKDIIKVDKPKFSTYNCSHSSIDTYEIGDLNVGYFTLMSPGEIVKYKSNIIGKFDALKSPAYAHMRIKEYAFFVPINQIDHNFSEFIMNTKKENQTFIENGEKTTINRLNAPNIALEWLSIYCSQLSRVGSTVPTNSDQFTRSGFSNYNDRRYVSKLANQLGIPFHCVIPCYYDGDGVSEADRAAPSAYFQFYRDAIGISLDEGAYSVIPAFQTGHYLTYWDSTFFNSIPIDINIFRAYQHIWNCYFRDSRLQEPVDLYPDFFERAMPYNAGIDSWFMGFGSTGEERSQAFRRFIWNVCRMRKKSYQKDVFNTASTDPTLGASAMSLGSNIVELRKNSAMQRFLEKKALGGSRYADWLLMYFGVDANDYDVDMPIYLGMSTSPIGISEIKQTSQTTVDSVLGDRAGEANTYANNKGYTFRAPDYGYFMTLICIEPEISYFQGINRKIIKKDWSDYPFPEFAGIGMQTVYPCEVYTPICGDEHFSLGTYDSQSFGYSPRYYEWKQEPNRVQGQFENYLSYWHQSPNFLESFNYQKYVNLNKSFPLIGMGADLNAVVKSDGSSSDTSGTGSLSSSKPYYNNIFTVTSDNSFDHAQMNIYHQLSIRRAMPTNDMPHL